MGKAEQERGQTPRLLHVDLHAMWMLVAKLAEQRLDASEAEQAAVREDSHPVGRIRSVEHGTRRASNLRPHST
jgi:hypothetical protein